jgi:hypothetical protein
MIGSADIIQETAVLGGFFRERGGLELQIHAALDLGVGYAAYWILKRFFT